MTEFSIVSMPLSTVLYLHSERETLHLDPDYQRESDIWPLEKRQLLIDSIINGYAIPKIYFHKFRRPKKIRRRTYAHAIIDGKQRLTTIWSYIDGEFPLSQDVEYIGDSRIDLRGLTYAQLGNSYPRLKTRFDSYYLSVVCIETEDMDLIEDMFSRLNEAVPLSAAEKRNAFGGPMPAIIRRVARTRFCTRNLPFANSRYRHYDVIAKFLLVEDRNEIVDTKKVYLDGFVKNWKGKRKSSADAIGKKSMKVMLTMANTFNSADPLLRSVGMVMLYYHVFRIAMKNGWVSKINRKKFASFERTRTENRKAAEKEMATAQYDLLEFDRYVQTPNDSYAIVVRLRILLKHVFKRELPKEYAL